MQQQMAQMQAMSEAYDKTTKAPEEGSGAQLLEDVVTE